MIVLPTYIHMSTPVISPSKTTWCDVTLMLSGYLSHLECLNPEAWQCEDVYVGATSTLQLSPGGPFTSWEALGVKGRLRHRFYAFIPVTIRVRNIGQELKAFTGRLHVEYLI